MTTDVQSPEPLCKTQACGTLSVLGQGGRDGGSLEFTGQITIPFGELQASERECLKNQGG